ncbi:MAG: hypothetical protein P8Z71_11975 [Candidatus Sulfobium sp.]|jgi:hypothetical protein
MKEGKTLAMEDKMLSLSDAVMKCDDYSEADSRCDRGIPVAPLFGHYYCTGKHEDCPLRLWVKTLPRPADVVRPTRKPSIVRRKA